MSESHKSLPIGYYPTGKKLSDNGLLLLWSCSPLLAFWLVPSGMVAREIQLFTGLPDS